MQGPAEAHFADDTRLNSTRYAVFKIPNNALRQLRLVNICDVSRMVLVGVIAGCHDNVYSRSARYLAQADRISSKPDGGLVNDAAAPVTFEEQCFFNDILNGVDFVVTVIEPVTRYVSPVTKTNWLIPFRGPTGCCTWPVFTRFPARRGDRTGRFGALGYLDERFRRTSAFGHVDQYMLVWQCDAQRFRIDGSKYGLDFSLVDHYIVLLMRC